MSDNILATIILLSCVAGMFLIIGGIALCLPLYKKAKNWCIAKREKALNVRKYNIYAMFEIINIFKGSSLYQYNCSGTPFRLIWHVGMPQNEFYQLKRFKNALNKDIIEAYVNKLKYYKNICNDYAWQNNSSNDPFNDNNRLCNMLEIHYSYESRLLKDNKLYESIKGHTV